MDQALLIVGFGSVAILLAIETVNASSEFHRTDPYEQACRAVMWVGALIAFSSSMSVFFYRVIFP